MNIMWRNMYFYNLTKSINVQNIMKNILTILLEILKISLVRDLNLLVTKK